MRAICIYTYDGDATDQRRFRQELREMGFTKPLSWKASSATRVGIYSGGADGRASRYRE